MFPPNVLKEVEVVTVTGPVIVITPPPPAETVPLLMIMEDAVYDKERLVFIAAFCIMVPAVTIMSRVLEPTVPLNVTTPAVPAFKVILPLLVIPPQVIFAPAGTDPLLVVSTIDVLVRPGPFTVAAMDPPWVLMIALFNPQFPVMKMFPTQLNAPPWKLVLRAVAVKLEIGVVPPTAPLNVS
jgi:hypothetical protein